MSLLQTCHKLPNLPFNLVTTLVVVTVFNRLTCEKSNSCIILSWSINRCFHLIIKSKSLIQFEIIKN